MLALLVYDWLLCLGPEIQFIWNWRRGVTVPFLVYCISRYAMLIQTFLIVATIYPMSDRVRRYATTLSFDELMIAYAEVASGH